VAAVVITSSGSPVFDYNMGDKTDIFLELHLVTGNCPVPQRRPPELGLKVCCWSTEQLDEKKFGDVLHNTFLPQVMH